MKYSWRTFTLTLMVMIGLVGLGFLPQITVGDHLLRVVDIFSDLKKEPEPEVEEPVVAEEEDTKKEEVTEDTEQSEVVSFADDKGEKFIDFSTNDSSSMKSFYAKLKDLKADPKKNVRIAYFGDSFIEGDIFTCDIRDSLQSLFGGGGVGMYDISSAIEGARGTILQKSEGFSRKAINSSDYVNAHGSTNLHYCQPTGPNAQVTFEKSAYTRIFRKHNSDIHLSTVYFTTDVPLMLTGVINDTLSKEFTFAPSPNVQSATVQGNIDRLQWKVNNGGSQNSWFYSVTLEKGSGIQLDNISLRGSNGRNIKDVDDNHMAQMAKLRPYDLILLGFGLNYASDQLAANGYKQYQGEMKEVIAKLRRHYPKAPIVIVSVSDRCQRNSSGGISTMPSIKTLVETQYNIAKANHTAYWNLFQGMGGDNSMQRLVEDRSNGRPKGNSDYTHITYDGGKVIARPFMSAFMAGYK